MARIEPDGVCRILLQVRTVRYDVFWKIEQCVRQDTCARIYLLGDLGTYWDELKKRLNDGSIEFAGSMKSTYIGRSYVLNRALRQWLHD